MELVALTPEHLELAYALECDPAVMRELGGVRTREEVERKHERRLRLMREGMGWIYIVREDGRDAGLVCVWDSENKGERLREIGWMLLPRFQGRGLGRRAVEALLASGDWPAVHAFTTPTNAPSNGICRSLGFVLVDELEREFAGKRLPARHWRWDRRS